MAATVINPRDISVVVQGPIAGKLDDPPGQRYTYMCLESIMRHLPGSEVVLTTWKGSDVAGLPYDKLVESNDPGGWNQHRDPNRVWLNNVGRQITTTKAGLLAATRPYAVKIRSDMLLTGDGFLGYFGKYGARNPAWKILRDRVVTSTVFARNPHRSWPFPFHPSDCFHFGWREDLLDMWDIPLPPEPENSRWFDTHPMPQDRDPDMVYRYNPEQYMWTTFLRKHGRVHFRHRSDRRHGAAKLSELTIVNNLVVAEPSQLEITFLKFAVSRAQWASLYTHGEWLRLYRKYCDKGFQCPPDTLLWRKRAYEAVLWPVYAGLPRRVSGCWKAISPASFNFIKSAYLTLFNRNTAT